MKKLLFVLLAANTAFELSASGRIVRLMRPGMSPCTKAVTPLFVALPTRLQSPMATGLFGVQPQFSTQANNAINQARVAQQKPRTQNAALIAAMLAGGSLLAFTQYQKYDIDTLYEDISKYGLYNNERAQKVVQKIMRPDKINSRDSKGRTLLHLVAYKTDRNTIQQAITQGADINATDKEGNTPLHYATNTQTRYDWGKTVELLITQGANVNAQNLEGQTPLHTALIAMSTPERKKRDGGTSAVTLLTYAPSANLNIKDKEGRTPLHLAAILGVFPMGDLVKKGADINAQDNNGNTPLHILLTSSGALIHPDYLEPIIASGANPHIKNNQGLSVLDILNQKNRMQS